MFGNGSGRSRGVRVHGLVWGGALAAVCVALVGVQSAGGQAGPKPPSSPQKAAAGLRARLAARGRPTAAAVVGGRPTVVSCGQVLTASTTLAADLNCTGGSTDGLDLGANGIVLNLNGHFITGGSGGYGVKDTGYSSDTIENGYIIGFVIGVYVASASNTVTKLQLTGATSAGILIGGAMNQVTSNTVAENTNAYGVDNGGSGNTLKGNHLLNDGEGLFSNGSGSQISGNVANGNGPNNGNAYAGIAVYDYPPATLTANTANYNSGWGIYVASPQIDGGLNAAKGNTTQAQCTGVVCR